MKIFVLLLAFVFMNAGCVLKSKHDETLAREIRCEQDAKKLGSDLEQLNQKIEEAKRKLSDTESRNEELSQTNQMLVNKNSEITKKTSSSQEELLGLKTEKAKVEQKSAQLKQTYDDLFKIFGPELENQSIELHQGEDEITFSIQEATLFSTPSNDITSSGLKLIEKVLGHLKKMKPKQVSIESFSEPPPPKPRKGQKRPATVNVWERSASRAAKVVTIFEKGGISSSALQAIGRGEISTSSKQKNGWVEINVTF